MPTILIENLKLVVVPALGVLFPVFGGQICVLGLRLTTLKLRVLVGIALSPSLLHSPYRFSHSGGKPGLFFFLTVDFQASLAGFQLSLLPLLSFPSWPLFND